MFLKSFFLYFLTWLQGVLVACGIFSCSMQTFSCRMWGLVP